MKTKRKAYPDALGAPTGSRKLMGGMSRGASRGRGPPLDLPSGLACARVVAAGGCLPLAAVELVLATLAGAAAEEEPVPEARLAGTFGGLA